MVDIRNGVTPSQDDVLAIIASVIPIFDSEPNILRLEPPITVCGDTHGQLYDLFRIFDNFGEVPIRSYLFLGDYVDRGYYSIELLVYLLCLKIKYPKNIYMLRGNHECREVNTEYGFLEEIETKYNNADIFATCNELFRFLPLSAIINNRIFCVHGGLSPQLEKIQQIEELDRKVEPKLDDMMSHLLWSDPSDVSEWKRNTRRSGYLYGEKHVEQFLSNNKLEMIVRSHEMMDGYKKMFGGKLLTVWGAPNYCYICDNLGSVLHVENNPNNDKIEVYSPMPASKRKTPSMKTPYYS